jgi:hypothetical protein
MRGANERDKVNDKSNEQEKMTISNTDTTEYEVETDEIKRKKDRNAKLMITHAIDRYSTTTVCDVVTSYHIYHI